MLKQKVERISCMIKKAVHPTTGPAHLPVFSQDSCERKFHRGTSFLENTLNIYLK